MLIILAIAAVFGIFGALIASSKNNSAGMGFLLGFLLGPIGLIILALSKAQPATEPAFAARQQSAGSASLQYAPAAAIPSTASSYDVARWNALVEFDSDIAQTEAAVRPFGQKYVGVLAEKFLALNDKTYLASIVEKITTHAAAETAREAEDSEIVEEGNYMGRLWRRRRDGKIIGEVGQTNYEFNSVEEHRDAIRKNIEKLSRGRYG